MVCRLLFELKHERSGDALAAGVGMDEELCDVGAVGLVGWRVEEELDGAGNLMILCGGDEDAIALRDLWGDFGEPPLLCVFMLEGEDEADACAGVDASVEERGELVELIVRDRCDRFDGHQARASWQ